MQLQECWEDFAKAPTKGLCIEFGRKSYTGRKGKVSRPQERLVRAGAYPSCRWKPRAKS